jgi:hypothetical protein
LDIFVQAEKQSGCTTSFVESDGRFIMSASVLP